MRVKKDFVIQREHQQIKDCFIILDGEVELTHGYKEVRNFNETINIKKLTMRAGGSFNEEAVTLASYMDEKASQRKRNKIKQLGKQMESFSKLMENKSPGTVIKIS